jgi:hypothetical protein
MIKIRRLQLRNDEGRWALEAYAIEDAEGRVTLRYPLGWEYLGARYNGQIREQNLGLDQLEELVSGERLRWLQPEVVEDALVGRTLEALDRECHIPLRGAVRELAA